MTGFARAALGRCSWAVTAAALAVLLAACSSSHPSTITGPVGTSVGVSLSSPTGTTQLQQGTQLVLTATVTSDPTNAGVTWTLSGPGQLVNETKTTVTYQAPTGVSGTASALLTATAVADTTKGATTLMVTLGTPVMNATNLFPGYLTIPYATQLSVAGGLGPFAWTISGGALPPGITLGASTVGFDSIAGTATSEGTYNFQVTVTDANKKTTSADLTLVIKGAAACLIDGPYALVYSGFVNGAASSGAASFIITSTGSLTGYHNFNGPGAPPIAEALTGTCATRSSNNGLLSLTGVGQANQPVYNFAMTVGLLNGRVQLVNGGDAQSGTGPLERQNALDFVLSKLAGDFSFGALGAQLNDARAGIAGTLTVNAGGVVTDGHMDSNDTSAMTDAALTGAFSPPDVNGHGNLTLTAALPGSSRVMHFAYYIINADRLFITSTDTGLYVSGFMTRKSGSFDNSSMVIPSILNLWGAAPVPSPKSVISLGRFSGANTGTGTINIVLDTSNATVNTYEQAIGGARYAVRADGRTTVSFTSAGIARNFTIYLSGPSTGYLVEHGSSSGSAGLIEAQAPGPYVANVIGLFVSGMQYPEDESPIVLMPAVYLTDSSFSSTYATGYYTLDSVTGRGIGSLTISGIGVGVYTFYFVRPDKVLTLRMATQFASAGLAWMDSD